MPEIGTYELSPKYPTNYVRSLYSVMRIPDDDWSDSASWPDPGMWNLDTADADGENLNTFNMWVGYQPIHQERMEQLMTESGTEHYRV